MRPTNVCRECDRYHSCRHSSKQTHERVIVCGVKAAEAVLARMSQSTPVDLGLGGSQAGEAQREPGAASGPQPIKLVVCPEGFDEYCVNDDGATCPSYRDGHCDRVEEEREL